MVYLFCAAHSNIIQSCTHYCIHRNTKNAIALNWDTCGNDQILKSMIKVGVIKPVIKLMTNRMG